MASPAGTSKVKVYCAMCIARCGAIATVTDGRFSRLDPDPSHPTGKALCAKGRAAPELVYHKDRLTQPLRRTRPKGNGRSMVSCPFPGKAHSCGASSSASGRACKRSETVVGTSKLLV